LINCERKQKNNKDLKKGGEWMIVGTGIDLVELERIESTLARQARFYERVLTTKEQELFLTIT
jgi:Phosphopantetheinyl transferase (holo-ACP synthase)